ncbi:MAG: FMN-binding protein [Verrucomicrobiaceae bacterium]|nr:FMN-binding protein [Verrucomicrobiaceae bacterium]
MKTIPILAFLIVAATANADTIELANGNKVEGKVLENNAEAKTLTVEFSLAGTLTKRTVPYSALKALTVNGTRTDLNAPAAAVAATARTPAEVQALIDKTGSTEPDWLKSTKLSYPKSLDLSWAAQPPGKWDNQKYVGQFLWDIINPNTGRWQEGIKFVLHVLEVNEKKNNAEIIERATKEIANMHFRFFQDYARAAWWWQKAGVTMDDAAGVHLAECYWRLGSKQMALDMLTKAQALDVEAIKLFGDMGETDQAVELAKNFDHYEAWMLAGDACRLAGRIPEAKTYFEKVLNTPDAGARPVHLKHTKGRAQANLEALTLYELADVSKVADGTYKDSSLGYEGQVEVRIKVSGKKIEDVKITQHKEKQYYSSMRDVPDQIIAKKGVKGVDATSRATITSEAIINAVAKALAQGTK